MGLDGNVYVREKIEGVRGWQEFGPFTKKEAKEVLKERRALFEAVVKAMSRAI